MITVTGALEMWNQRIHQLTDLASRLELNETMKEPEKTKLWCEIQTDITNLKSVLREIHDKDLNVREIKTIIQSVTNRST